MRAKLEQLSLQRNNQSFLCYEVNVPGFAFLWHYHPEYELTFIVKGSGKRLVGDSYEQFSEGDLVLLGPNLPHSWVSEQIKKQNCQAIVIQFSTEFIAPLLQYQEMKDIEKLLSRAEKGLHFKRLKNKEIIQILHEIKDSKAVDAFTLLIQLLHKLSANTSIVLSSSEFKPLKGNQNQQRINKIFQFIQKGFREKISLQKAAALIHLSESAFCKFFKRACGKSFSDYVNDIRVSNACQLLIETDKPIAQIAFESGFESLTYFNRVFLKKKKVRPGEFRKMIF
ncbi:MAG TPA: AraC family transcriptional regulator [Panacibacter sp.]|nr:AraC family transcriptional regulator [Panacibacter sp.]